MPSVLCGLAASTAVAASFLLLLASVARATTILASTFDGGVVIGTDSRTSQGNFVVNRLSDKIAPVYPTGIFLARSGNTADTQYVAGVVEAKLDAYRTQFGRDPTVRAAATVTRNLCYANKDGISASFICAGWDAREGSSVFVVDKGGTLLEQTFAIGGSGSPFAMGYCDLHLRPGLDRDECVMHVQKAIELAIGRDGSSGGVVRLCVVSAAGVERWTATPSEQARGGEGGEGGVRGGGGGEKKRKMEEKLEGLARKAACD